MDGMMTFLRRFAYELRYIRRPPWDSGIVPPEVEAFIRDTSPGRALDLGCGTGTSSLALAGAGWQVTGIDFAARAIHIAKEKAASQNLPVEFLLADVLHLPVFPDPFDLILDIGCFHALSSSHKTIYLKQLESLIASGGTWLMYGFINPGKQPGAGIIPADLERVPLKMVKRQDGVDRKARPSAWFWFEEE
jgi:2-polyprenyl-3-methyl-5-hydroxy-6-metoxy-1,4-benzoquinol methylase